MDLGLIGRTCVVTGASRGIGLAATKALFEEGARVLMVARGQAGLDEAAGALLRASSSSSGQLETLALQITRCDAPDRILSVCTERFGGLEVLVNNAGVSSARSLEELDEAAWTEQWALNVMAPMRLMRRIAPAMAEAGWGRIVNVCSSAGIRTSLTNIAYSVTKAAELKLSSEFAEAYSGGGVTINAVVPGAVATGLWLDPGGLADQIAAARGISHEQALEAQSQRTLLGRLAEPQEVAAVIVLLCSRWAEIANGVSWPVGVRLS
jgi:3-oxoacyl-[acyl-carrier protein] reductase